MLRYHFFSKGLLYALLLLLLLPACGLREREQKIQRKEQDIIQKQAELLLKEQQLTAKEKELKDKELFLDSTRRYIDTANIYDARITGKWSVKMNCTETDCEGSAIGDTKTELWEISYGANNSVVAKAYAGKKLTRIYNGYYKKSGLQLSDEQSIKVTLTPTQKDKMEGTREISQAGCKIIYSLNAEKMP